MSMEIKWTYQEQAPIKLKTFLKQKGLSRRLLATIRNDNGQVEVNGKSGRIVDKLYPNDQVWLRLPVEKNRKQSLAKSYVPLKIIYEDRDFLIIDKPARVATIPSRLHPVDSLVNRVAGYYDLRGYQGIIPHVATRLDRDTSGLVLFAKHRLAHALLDQQLRQHEIDKRYWALLTGPVTWTKLEVNQPIARLATSTMKRGVAADGKAALTDFEVIQRLGKATLCQVKLHTGRTHQIRVHSQYLGHPLVGDELYGGNIELPLQRQALHCQQLSFYHPFLEKQLRFVSELPADMQGYIEKNR